MAVACDGGTCGANATELTTAITLSADYWIDDEMPLSYGFASQVHLIRLGEARASLSAMSRPCQPPMRAPVV